MTDVDEEPKNAKLSDGVSSGAVKAMASKWTSGETKSEPAIRSSPAENVAAKHVSPGAVSAVASK